MKTPKLIAAFAALALTQGAILAAETDPVGFVSNTVPANSDAVLGVPLYRAAEFRGIIQSISGNVVTVVGAPAWATNQFVQDLPGQPKTYAVLIASGTKEGMIGLVTANATNTLTVTLDSNDDFTTVKTEATNPGAADQIDVLPFWTPTSLLGTVPTGTEFLGFQSTGAGTNIAAIQVLGYTGTGWEDQITSDDASHLPLNFGSAFIVRNNSASAVVVSMVGSVPMSAHRTNFKTLAASTDQDIRFGFSSPVPESIISLGIPAAAGDAILGFDNAATGKNKAAATIFAYDGTQWVDDITGDPLDVNAKLQPGFGYIYRKFRTGAPATVTWQKLQSYLQ